MSDNISFVHLPPGVLAPFLDILDTHFPSSDRHYLTVPRSEYRHMVLEAQDAMNGINGPDLIATSILDELRQFVDASDVLIQSNLYLRAARPDRSMDEESIGWHRESFYGPEMSAAVNVWTPLRGVTAKNTIRYIPNSGEIPDEELATVNEPSKYTERFSDGHKIGFLYAPKRITSGVDLTLHKPLLVNVGQTAIFDGNLIHGAAVNHTDSIRFSIDFRVIAAHKYSDGHKRLHFASGRSYFKSLTEPREKNKIKSQPPI